MHDDLFSCGVAQRPWFFCGIGGSGMLPLAQILRAHGAQVAGSDRSRDQGRLPEKFAALERAGFTLYPQDGSGITSPEQVLVASAAIEDSVPEVARAQALGCVRMTRAQVLAGLFNAAGQGIAVAGTSGKSTVTGMIGWILHATGRDPTVMNGAVMKNFATVDQPYASARVGQGTAFISEVDESDGSIALYRPAVGVLLNVTRDHMEMEALRTLFSDFLGHSAVAVVNADDAEAATLAPHHPNRLSFALNNPEADLSLVPGSHRTAGLGQSAQLRLRPNDMEVDLSLRVPGQHNLSNALAALAAAIAVGVSAPEAAAALAEFTGLGRRFELVGTSASGVTVIDDFAHNPDKCAATLRTLAGSPGRVIAYFQPHGFGPLRQMGEELAQVLASELRAGDHLLVSDPAYFGGTVDRSVGAGDLVEWVRGAAGNKGIAAEHCPERAACGDRIVALARPGDRVVVMGARDDTLSDFARELLARL